MKYVLVQNFYFRLIVNSYYTIRRTNFDTILKYSKILNLQFLFNYSTLSLNYQSLIQFKYDHRWLID